MEADGTFLKAQQEPGDRFEVKTGVFYTGKAPAGGRRHRRWTRTLASTDGAQR